MNGGVADRPIVANSVRFYEILTAAYPARFRQEYGRQMLQVFRDCCVRAIDQNGMLGIARLWAATLLDLVQSLLSEHAQKEIQVKRPMKPEDVRRAGSALMWGSGVFALATLLQTFGGERLWGISMLLTNFLSMPLIVAGLLGIRSRYADKVGLGGGILLFGSILGLLTTVLGLIGLSYGIMAMGFLIIISPGLLLACVALFGLVALVKRPLPRWNWAPVVAGVWYPVLTALYLVNVVRTGDPDGGSTLRLPTVAAIIVLAVVQGLALAALGYVLKSDAPEETTMHTPPSTATA